MDFDDWMKARPEFNMWKEEFNPDELARDAWQESRRRALEEAAEWLESNGQPGYAVEIRNLDD